MGSKIFGKVPMDGADTVVTENLPLKPGMWGKIKSFFLQEITVELTPAQQQFENDLNDFLHIELTWQDFRDFLFQDISFKK